jgi:hypothetical protein
MKIYLSDGTTPSNYLLIYNIKDKKITGKRNDGLINILCNSAIADEEALILDTLFAKRYSLGDVVQYKNIFFCFTMNAGGKPSIKDTNEMRIEYFRICVAKVSEIIDKTVPIYCDYANIILDPHNNYDTEYKKILPLLCKELNININIIINTKVKLILKKSYEKEELASDPEPKLDLHLIKYISNIWFTEADLRGIII